MLLSSTLVVGSKRSCSAPNVRQLKQPRRRRQQQRPHKFAYLTMKNNIFARFARAFFIFWHFVDVLVLSTTLNYLFCSCVDDVSIWWQMFNFVFLCPKRWFQFNSRVVRTHFSSIMTLNHWKMIAETRSYIFRWLSCFRQRRVELKPPVTPMRLPKRNTLTFTARVRSIRKRIGSNKIDISRQNRSEQLFEFQSEKRIFPSWSRTNPRCAIIDVISVVSNNWPVRIYNSNTIFCEELRNWDWPFHATSFPKKNCATEAAMDDKNSLPRARSKKRWLPRSCEKQNKYTFAMPTSQYWVT